MAAGREPLRALFRLRVLGSPPARVDQRLRDGDTIFLPAAEIIYIYGQIKSPGSFPIKSGTTVLQALSLAGGVTGPVGAAIGAGAGAAGGAALAYGVFADEGGAAKPTIAGVAMMAAR